MIGYKAFISYRHSTESRPHAERLEAALKRYARGFLRPPVPLFRDERILRPGDDLPSALRAALEASEFLIFLASPEAVQSEWIADELRIWCHELHRADRLMIVHVAGRIAVDAAAESIDWTKTDALPPLLRPHLGRIPIWIDLTWAVKDEQRDLNNADYRKAVNALVARFRGLLPEEMNDEEVLTHRRNVRLRNIGIGAVGLFAVVAAGAAYVANTQRHVAVQQRASATASAVVANEQRRVADQQRALATASATLADERRIVADEQRAIAEDQRTRAIERQKIALSNQLAAQALGQAGSRLDLALLLGVEATRPADTAEARSSLLRTLQSAPGLVTFLHGHRGPVTRVAFSPDGATLASGGADRTVRLWTVAGPAAPAPPLYTHDRSGSGKDDEVRTLAFSPDGSLVASGSMSGTLRVAEVETRTPRGEQREFGGTVSTLAFTANSKAAVIGSIGLSLLDVTSVSARASAFLPSRFPGAVAFDAEGRLLAVHEDEGLFLYDVASGTRVSSALAERFPGIDTLVFSRDGKLLLAGDRAGTVRLWNVEARAPVGQPLRGDGIVLAARFSEDGTRMTWVRSDGSVRSWRVDGWTPEAGPVFVGPISSAAFDPRGRLLALGGADGSLRLWDTSPSRHPLGEDVSTAPDALDAVAISPDGTLIATGGDSLALWDLASRRRVRDFRNHNVLGVAFSGDGRTLLSAGVNGVSLWDLATNSEYAIPGLGKEPYNWSLALSPDGRTLAFGGKALTLWNVAGRTTLPSPLADKGSVRAVAFSPDGRTLAAGAEDKTIRLWELPSGAPLGKPLAARVEVWALAFTRDGRALASGGNDGTLQLWSLKSLAAMGAPLPGHSSRVRSIGFSPDGTLMASAGSNQTLLLHDVASRQLLGEALFAHAEYEVVSGVAFGPGGALLVASHRRKALSFLDGGPAAWKSRACRLANRNLTQEEWCRYLRDEPYQKTCPTLPGPASVTCR